jgi:hypothetical protein
MPVQVITETEEKIKITEEVEMEIIIRIATKVEIEEGQIWEKANGQITSPLAFNKNETYQKWKDTKAGITYNQNGKCSFCNDNGEVTWEQHHNLVRLVSNNKIRKK